MGSARLKTKFIILLVGVFIAALVANIAWTDYVFRQQMEHELQERGRVVALQMKQTWNYLVETRVEPSEDAVALYYTVYEGDNCAVAGREISLTFTDSSDYITRYVSDHPRNEANSPDEFELEMIELFRNEPEREWYGSIVTVDGVQVYRYAEPMRITEICLDCHGGPKGEIDPTGYPKEGLALGDTAGVASVVVPIGTFLEQERFNALRSVAMFAILLTIVLIAVYIGLTRLVTRPLAHAQQAFVRVGNGDLETRMDTDLHSREMTDLALSFNKSAESLAGAYNNLEMEVQDRTAQLREANAVLEQQQRQLEQVNEQLRTEIRYKSDFLSIVSHELRTPLTSILAFTEMLKDNASLGEEGETARREIETNSRVLLLMINDILEMNRLDAGRMQLGIEAVDVYDLLGFVESVVQPIARRASVELNCDPEPYVPVIQGDFDKLAHAVENLAFNAVKFTPEGGAVTIGAHTSADGASVLITVSDTGIGIAPEDQERIFERFVQADSSSVRRYNGTGLGLPLAREYVELHGGTLELESTLGQGSTFTITLPVQPLQEAESEE